MARPERELEARGRLRQLAKWLRDQRARANLAYRQMAEMTGIPATTLSRAASGETLPSRHTVREFARACGANPDKAGQLRDAAAGDWRRHRAGRHTQPGHRGGAYYPENVISPESLIKALSHLRARAGQPSLEELARRTRDTDRYLPSSTISDLFTGRSQPTLATVLAVATACGEREDGLALWRNAWMRSRTGPERPIRLYDQVAEARARLHIAAEQVPEDLTWILSTAPGHENKRVTDLERRVVDLWQSGLSRTQVEERTGLSRDSVLVLLQRWNAKQRRRTQTLQSTASPLF